MPRIVLFLGVVSMLTDVSSEAVAAVPPLYLTAVVGLTPLAYGYAVPADGSGMPQLVVEDASSPAVVR